MEMQFALEWRSQTHWSWRVALDLFSGGLGAGLFLISLWAGSPLGAWIAVALVAFAGLVLLSHLGHPTRFWRAFARAKSSWISRGAIYMTLFIILAALALLTGGAAQSPWQALGGLGKTLAVLAAIAAVLVMVYPGFVLAASPSIPFWNSPLLPVLFAGFSVAGGVLMLALVGEVPAAVAKTVPGLALTFLGLCLVLLFFHLEIMKRSTAAAQESVQWLMRGRLAGLFLFGVIGVGLVLPAVLLGIGLAMDAPAIWMQVAAVPALVGGLLFRQSLLKAGIYGPPV